MLSYAVTFNLGHKITSESEEGVPLKGKVRQRQRQVLPAS